MKNLRGFTLAEVLITLGVIGVVAAITMPTVIANINERVNSERQANIAQKVTQAMEQMRAHGLLNTKYASTDAFVDELQKYLKIAKRCSASNIADCWPTEKVTDANGKEFEVSKAKTGANLNHKNNKTNNVGLVLADGASIIMTYDENAGGLDVGDAVTAIKKELPVGGGKFKEFPYATSVAGAVDFVMDVNGAKGPNSETVDGKYHDIRSFNGAQFAKGMVCDFEVGNLCVKNLGNAYSTADCSNSSDPCYSGYSSDYWTGAKNACEDISMHLATRNELTTIFNKNCTNGHTSCIPAIPTSGNFWATPQYRSDYGYYMNFSNGVEDIYGKLWQRSALCVGSN